MTFNSCMILLPAYHFVCYLVQCTYLKDFCLTARIIPLLKIESLVISIDTNIPTSVYALFFYCNMFYTCKWF